MEDSNQEKIDQEKSSNVKLSDAQKARMERNRQRAVLLKKSRVTSRPYPTSKPEGGCASSSHKEKVTRLIDTGGGFLIEEDEQVEEQAKIKVIHPKGALLEADILLCDDCEKEFLDSYLYENFGVGVCNKCREEGGDKHKLITKTDARNIYLLKDPDLDFREPPLKFILKKNPRNNQWGDMKLFLESQVAERALEVWGSEDKLEEERERRMENKEKVKQKRYDKKVKDLRRAVRSSLWRKDAESHEHTYGPEKCINDDDDIYSKTCTECDHTLEYEKM